MFDDRNDKTLSVPCSKCHALPGYPCIYVEIRGDLGELGKEMLHFVHTPRANLAQLQDKKFYDPSGHEGNPAGGGSESND
jgi:hypothetical protein